VVGEAPPSRPPGGLRAGLLASVAGQGGGLPLVVPPGLHPVAGGQQVYLVQHDLLDRGQVILDPNGVQRERYMIKINWILNPKIMLN
jgi:hypothetical protein